MDASPHSRPADVPREREWYVQGYLAHKKQRFPWDPTVGLCLGPDGDPGGVGGGSYE